MMPRSEIAGAANILGMLVGELGEEIEKMNKYDKAKAEISVLKLNAVVHDMGTQLPDIQRRLMEIRDEIEKEVI